MSLGPFFTLQTKSMCLLRPSKWACYINAVRGHPILSSFSQVYNLYAGGRQYDANVYFSDVENYKKGSECTLVTHTYPSLRYGTGKNLQNDWYCHPSDTNSISRMLSLVVFNKIATLKHLIIIFNIYVCKLSRESIRKGYVL